MNPRRCIAPLDAGERLCGAPATTSREIAGLTCALCDAHAREIDRDAREDRASTAARSRRE